jgi:hypothetical protein
MSLASPGFSLVADAQGEASFSFDFGLLPPGARAVVQAVTVASGRLSTPAPVAVLP